MCRILAICIGVLLVVSQVSVVCASGRALSQTPPYRLCVDFIRPSGPGNLKVIKVGTNSVEACWDTPTNYGCADSYDVQVTPRVTTGVGGSILDSIRVQSGKCATVNKLRRNQEYTMTVTSYSNRYNGGGSSSVNFRTK